MLRKILIISIVFIILQACTVSAEKIQATDSEEPLVTVQFRDTPIKSAIEVLFRGTNRGYVLESGTNGLVTCSIKDTPFDQALNAVLRSAGCTHRIENGVYIICPKKQETQIYAQQEPWVKEQEQSKPKTRVVKIPIQFVDCLDIANILGVETMRPRNWFGGGYPSRHGYFGGGFTGIYMGGPGIYGGYPSSYVPFGIGYGNYIETPTGYREPSEQNPFSNQEIDDVED
ncbi:MAG: hypothetical protein QHH26_09180 [Armatimonadota bacterium]|nr:hypothetical protein [Armatimonadota bacterium]